MYFIGTFFLAIMATFASLEGIYQLAVTAIFQDEARFLQEWIEYYKLQGAEHFYLYNHLSQDNYAEVLSPYIARGEVDLFDCITIPKDWKHWDTIQKDAYKHALRYAVHEAKWLAIVDVDEYVVPIVEETYSPHPLRRLLASYAKDTSVGGICIPWVFFGTSQIEKLSPHMLLTETLILNGGAACNGDISAIWQGGSYKSIVRPQFVKEVNSPHWCSYSGKRQHVMVDFNQAQLNHYWTRDEEHLRTVKAKRRASWGQPVDEVYHWASGMQQLTTYSLPILKFVPELRRRLQKQPGR